MDYDSIVLTTKLSRLRPDLFFFDFKIKKKHQKKTQNKLEIKCQKTIKDGLKSNCHKKGAI